MQRNNSSHKRPTLAPTQHRCLHGVSKVSPRPATTRSPVSHHANGLTFSTACSRNLPRPPTEHGRRLQRGQQPPEPQQLWSECWLPSRQLGSPSPAKASLSVVGSCLAGQDRKAHSWPSLSIQSWGDGLKQWLPHPSQAGCPTSPLAVLPRPAWGAAMAGGGW